MLKAAAMVLFGQCKNVQNLALFFTTANYNIHGKVIHFAYCTSVASKTTRQRGTQQFVPRFIPATKDELAKLQCFMDSHRNVVVLTGAGVSTESGQPDYRSEEVGLYARSSHRPVQFRDFMASAQIRKRYWLRNFVGWKAFSQLEPNGTHFVLAEWERFGRVSSLITQNVDRLHQKAGSNNVIELHGTTHKVKCMSCTYTIPRADLEKEFLSLNPNINVEVTELRPDSDVEINLSLLHQFSVPPCPSCGGFLKPDVVFFGENVSSNVVDAVYNNICNSDSLLVLGSSLYVYSGYRFLLYAAQLKKPIVIINIGPTRGDHLATLKIDSKCSEVLSHVKVS